MTSRRSVERFLAAKTVAVCGASRSGKKFGNTAANALRTQGYRVLPVHPAAATLDDNPCYPSLRDLPEPAGGVFVCVAPEQTESVVRDAHAAGIQNVWLQPGAQNDAAVEFCVKHGMNVVSNECILMFAQPTGIHKVHRWIWGAFGKLPK